MNMNKNRKHDEQVCSRGSPFGTTYLLEFFVFGLKMGLFENTVTWNKVKILYFEKVQFETTFAKRAPSLSCSKNVLWWVTYFVGTCMKIFPFVFFHL